MTEKHEKQSHEIVFSKSVGWGQEGWNQESGWNIAKNMENGKGGCHGPQNRVAGVGLLGCFIGTSSLRLAQASGFKVRPYLN